MKLGLSYNLFDGEELLKSAILSVRDNCDHINIVYQMISNFGAKASENLEDLLSDLQKEKLIDQLYRYEPNLILKAGKNEIIKRNIGLKLAKNNRCSHFMTIDCDEFYEKEQFARAKKFIEENKIDISACQFVNYLKKPTYQLQGLAFYHVPFISKIGFFSKYKRSNPFPVFVDPTRKLKGKNFKLFESQELMMHHMSLVRKDPNKKFNNAPIRDIFEKSGIAKRLEEYKFPDDWIDDVSHYIDPAAQRVFKVNEVPNKFDIYI